MKYMDGWPAAFARLADVCFVVEGVELPCHSQLLARSSSFFAGMFENLGPQLNTAAPLRLEAPLRGVKLPHFELFLHSVYCSPGGLEAAVASLPLTDLDQFGAICKLADKLDAAELRAALEKRAIGAQEDKKLLQQDLLGWIQLADRFQLPALRSRCVDLLLRQLVDGSRGKQQAAALDWEQCDRVLLLQLLDGAFRALHALQQERVYLYDIMGGGQHSKPLITLFDVGRALPAEDAWQGWTRMGDCQRSGP